MLVFNRFVVGDNAAAFGSDERFFGDDKEVNLLDDLY